MKRIFITEYVGLSTRLEALAMAFMISDRFGHQVCINWRDLDALSIAGVHLKGRGLLGRLNCLKLHSGNLDSLSEISSYRNINLRTHQGPKELLENYYLPTARKIKLRPDLRDIIQRTFHTYQSRPLVGVHIRRGDFHLVNETDYDVNAAEWQATPNWWYEHVMEQIQRAVPDVVFFVSCSGSCNDFPFLKKFDFFDMPASSPEGYKNGGHESDRHPAADLFALGCCGLLVGSSCSTFTHYAANMLGGPTTVLVPPAHKIFQAYPEFAQLNLYGRGAREWLIACRTGQGLQTVLNAEKLTVPIGAHTEWMC